MSHDLRWAVVTRNWGDLTRSHLEVGVEGRKLAYVVFDFLQGCSSQEEAVTRQETSSRDLRRPEVIRKWHHLSGSLLEVAIEVRKLAYTVRLVSYKAVARRRSQWRDRKRRPWPQETGGDPEVSSFDRKSPGSGCRTLKTGVYCAFDFLQGCCLQEDALKWQEMTSRDLRWLEVTSFERR